MIGKTIKFLKTTKLNYEIIIVNDGSKDKTWNVITDIMKNKFPQEQIFGVTYQNNGGKGWAVASGFKFARGKHILMLDADGATPIEDFTKLKQQLDMLENQQELNNDQKGALVIGSRKIIQNEENKVFNI